MDHGAAMSIEKPGTKERSCDLSGPALRTFFRVADAWHLSKAEQMSLLAISSRSTLHRWRAGKAARLGRDRLERISYIFGIFRAINILLPEPAQASAWMRAPNSANLFGGSTALERMCRGNVSDLYVVRRYLDAPLSQ